MQLTIYLSVCFIINCKKHNKIQGNDAIYYKNNIHIFYNAVVYDVLCHIYPRRCISKWVV